MNIKDFAKELLDVCKKYKKSIHVKVDSTSEAPEYEIDIHGQWPILEEHPAVEIYECALPELVGEITYSGKDLDEGETSSEAIRSSMHPHIWVRNDGLFSYEDETNNLNGAYDTFDSALNAFTNYCRSSLGK
jgi:hypothetical protein